jgi:hypothetical protein
LGAIDDPAAAGALLSLIDHADCAIRAAAVRSLGWSGESSVVAHVAGALSDDERRVRVAARAALAELGTPEAADRLAVTLDAIEPEELPGLVDALAWLRDRRALPVARHILVTAVANGLSPRGFRPFGWATARLGGDDEIQLIRSMARASFDPRALDSLPRPHTNGVLREDDGLALLRVLAHERPELVETLRADMVDGYGLDVVGRWEYDRLDPSPPVTPATARALLPRTVPKRAMVRLLEHPPAPGSAAKFGGQPDWISAPQWPLDPTGRPLIFYGQLPIIDRPGHLVYLFFAFEGDNHTPLGPGNAAVIQPGGSCHLETRPWATGPERYDGIEQPDRFLAVSKSAPHERFVELCDGLDPSVWERDWTASYFIPTEDANKIGGVPDYQQGEIVLPGDGWSFAFQFDGWFAGDEIAPGDSFYGYVCDDLRAAVSWQCG